MANLGFICTEGMSSFQHAPRLQSVSKRTPGRMTSWLDRQKQYSRLNWATLDMPSVLMKPESAISWIWKTRALVGLYPCLYLCSQLPWLSQQASSTGWVGSMLCKLCSALCSHRQESVTVMIQQTMHACINISDPPQPCSHESAQLTLRCCPVMHSS